MRRFGGHWAVPVLLFEMNIMERVNKLTFLLSAVAGYCDTTTFVAGNQTFSAHVTGNFILFAAQVVGADASAWLKLTTFPVFIFSVIIGGWLTWKAPGRYALLFVESMILIIAGVAALVFPYDTVPEQQWPVYTVVLLVVAAMGLQNAFSKVFNKETTGPTTMMTGNVTQLSLDIGTLFRNKFKGGDTALSLRKLLVNIGGFLGGCLVGGVMAKEVGLAAVGLPGLGLLFWFWVATRKMMNDNTIHID
jgi:uncharacterized membrane protein YoaK (UPF0700 family)